MNSLLEEIQGLSEKLMVQWYNEGLSLKKGQEGVLVIIKEYMDPQNPNANDAKECINGLRFLIK